MFIRVSTVWLHFLLLSSGLVCGQIMVTAEDKETSELPVDVEDCKNDFIVVGAGAAGCAVAAGLAARGYRVLLVEAGGEPGEQSKIPAAAFSLMGSSLDWQYQTVSNRKSCLASREGRCRVSRGKCLGGSTSINHMLCVRGNRQDYDYGISGWTWTDMKPYFLRYEGLKVLDDLPRSSIPYHNTSGILKMGFFDDPQNEWHSRIRDGYRQLGFPRNRDVNGVSQIGCGRLYGFVHKGKRMSTATAYLTDEGLNTNLKVVKETLCTRVIFDKNNVAQGIMVLPKGATEQQKLYATRGVVLCSGAISSPRILMSSGQGPADHLTTMGIPVRNDLPVGDNMSDHVAALIFVLVDTERTSEVSDVPPASIGITDINVFANTDCYDLKQRRLRNTCANCSLPTLQVGHAYVGRNVIPQEKAMFQQIVNLNNATIDQLAAANVDNGIIILTSFVTQPSSRGHVRLASTNPATHPEIFPNLLSDERDIKELERAIKILEQWVATPALKKRNARILRLKIPDCSLDGEDYWPCYIKHMTQSGFHAVGTTSLGKVVDRRLRVKGCHQLWVADAGVIPKIMRGNTEAAVVAVGERAVDLITNSFEENSGNK